MVIAAVTHALVGNNGLLIEAPELVGLLNTDVLETWRYDQHCLTAYSEGDEEGHIYRSRERDSYAYLRTNAVEGVVMVILNITRKAAANELKTLIDSEGMKGRKVELVQSNYGKRADDRKPGRRGAHPKAH